MQTIWKDWTLNPVFVLCATNLSMHVKVRLDLHVPWPLTTIIAPGGFAGFFAVLAMCFSGTTRSGTAGPRSISLSSSNIGSPSICREASTHRTEGPFLYVTKVRCPHCGTRIPRAFFRARVPVVNTHWKPQDPHGSRCRVIVLVDPAGERHDVYRMLDGETDEQALERVGRLIAA